MQPEHPLLNLLHLLSEMRKLPRRSKYCINFRQIGTILPETEFRAASGGQFGESRDVSAADNRLIGQDQMNWPIPPFQRFQNLNLRAPKTVSHHLCRIARDNGI